jgi:putative ABC transport system substrate-binding protein
MPFGQMKRREFLSLIGAVLAAPPLAAHAQRSGKIARVGLIGLTMADSLPKRTAAFRGGMRDLGYQEGRDFVIDYRWANGQYDRLPALFAELVELKVDVIVTHGTPGVLAAKEATRTIPIVFAVVGDALGSGIVSTLARPDANVTGSTFFNPELAAKRVELLKEAIPGLTDIGVLLNSANPMNAPVIPQMSRVAQSFKLALHQFGVRQPAEFEATFAAMAEKRIGALVVVDDAVLLAHAPELAALALRQRLPACGWSDFAVEGGLMSYGVDFPHLWRRAASFVDKLLKGAKPADLPVERASKFDTIVNLKTAKAIGIEMPTSLLLRADEVIE